MKAAADAPLCVAWHLPSTCGDPALKLLEASGGHDCLLSGDKPTGIRQVAPVVCSSRGNGLQVMNEDARVWPSTASPNGGGGRN